MRLAAEWQADDGTAPRPWWRRMLTREGGAVRVVVPGATLGDDRRLASYCGRCEAVVVHPKLN